jgi:hypothetical protein
MMKKWYNQKDVWKRIIIVLLFPLYQFGFDMIIWKYFNFINKGEIVFLYVFLPMCVLFAFVVVLYAVLYILGYILYNNEEYYIDKFMSIFD